MGITRIKDLVEAELCGRVRTYNWRKTPSQATTGGMWFDLSMSPGNPLPKYWFDAAPGIAKAAYQSTDGGFFHGANVAPSIKYLRKLTSMTATATALPMQMLICDYIVYYPSIDEGTTDVQTLDNTITLPRWIDGKGVFIIPITVGTRTTTATFYVNYTNSDGVAGRTSEAVTLNTAVVGTVAASNTLSTGTTGTTNPFLGLQQGDNGVRSIDSVTMTTISDGLFSLLLVKPLGTTLIKGIDAPVEKDFFVAQSQLIDIPDNAYINCLCLPQGTLAATMLMGDIKVIWN